MENDQADCKNTSTLEALKLGEESIAALLATVFLAVLLILTAIQAGPLWRDEVNTINVAQMHSLSEMWNNLQFESFPPLWPLLVRGCDHLGLTGTDTGIRILGLYVGLLFIGILWLSARWLGCRAPILSVALLGGLPAFIFIVGSNRAYGLACCLLVLSFGLLWRLLERPSRWRVLLAGIACFVYVHCVYYDAVFLAAMLGGGALVTLRRRQWKTLAALTVIGVVSAASLALYLPVVRSSSTYVTAIQLPNFGISSLWNQLREAVTVRSSGELGPNGPEIWLWIALVVGGAITALFAQKAPTAQGTDAAVPAGGGTRNRADLALYCGVSMLLGVAGLLGFMYQLHFYTHAWYYVQMFCICALALDGLLGANWPALRPWGWLRIGFLALLTCWSARATWAEAHTRRSNMDLIAAVINKNAAAGDLVVINSIWEGITFNRYYHGSSRWETIPPANSHLVHRTDLALAGMKQREPMVPVLHEITNTLQSGHSVWLVGNMSPLRPPPAPDDPLAKWYGTFFIYWTSQVSAELMDHAVHENIIDPSAGGPVNCLENPPLIRFDGYLAAPRPPAAGH